MTGALPDTCSGYLFWTKVGKRMGILCSPCCMLWPGSIDEMTYDHLWIEYDEHGALKTSERGPSTATEDTNAAWAKFAKRTGHYP